jgi:hypothetical protein
MSRSNTELPAVNLDGLGRIVLPDELLEQVQLSEYELSAGANESCGGSTNGSCNNEACGGSTNLEFCTNTFACWEATNRHFCLDPPG